MNFLNRLWCRGRGHRWSKRDGVDTKWCRRCGIVAAIKRRPRKTAEAV